MSAWLFAVADASAIADDTFTLPLIAGVITTALGALLLKIVR